MNPSSVPPPPATPHEACEARDRGNSLGPPEREDPCDRASANGPEEPPGPRSPEIRVPEARRSRARPDAPEAAPEPADPSNPRGLTSLEEPSEPGQPREPDERCAPEPRREPGRPGEPGRSPEPGQPRGPGRSPAPGQPGGPGQPREPGERCKPGQPREGCGEGFHDAEPPAGFLEPEPPPSPEEARSEPPPQTSENPETLSAIELHGMLLRAHRLGCALRHRFLTIFLAVYEGRRYLELGSSSMEEYASQHFGLERSETLEHIRVARALRQLPLSEQTFKEGKICWSALKELSRIADGETEAEWLEVASKVSTEELRLEVQDAARNKRKRPRKRPYGLPGIPVRLRFVLEPTEHTIVAAALELAAKEAAASLGIPSLKPKDALVYLATRVVEGRLLDREGAPPEAERSGAPYTILFRRCPDCLRSHVKAPAGYTEIPPQALDPLEGDAETVEITPEEEIPPEDERTPQEEATPQEEIPPEEEERLEEERPQEEKTGELGREASGADPSPRESGPSERAPAAAGSEGAACAREDLRSESATRAREDVRSESTACAREDPTATSPSHERAGAAQDGEALSPREALSPQEAGVRPAAEEAGAASARGEKGARSSDHGCAGPRGQEAEDPERGRGSPPKKDRPTPPKIARKIFLREGGVCGNPRCGRRGELHSHHVRFLAHGGKTAVWNEVLLCARCHALVHLGLLVIRGDPVNGFEFIPVAERPWLDFEKEMQELASIPPLQVVVRAGGASTGVGGSASVPPPRPEARGARAAPLGRALRGPVAALETLGYSASEARRRVEAACEDLLREAAAKAESEGRPAPAGGIESLSDEVVIRRALRVRERAPAAGRL